MANELNLDTLSTMALPEFLKAFKNRTPWKKANFVLLLHDYPLQDKKTTVALPFKKAKDVKEAYKKIKKEGKIPNPKRGYFSFELAKDENNKAIAKLKAIEGGLAVAKVEKKANKLFQKLKLALNFITGEEEASTPDSTEREENQDRQESSSRTTEETPQNNEGNREQNTDLRVLVEELKNSFGMIKAAFNDFKTNIVPKVREQNVGQQELQFIQELIDQINNFALEVAEAPTQIKDKFEQALAKFQAQIPKLEKILEMFGNSSNREESSEERQESIQQQQERIEEIRNRINEIREALAA